MYISFIDNEVFIMSLTQNMLLISWLQSHKSRFESAEELCDILTRRDRSQLPAIHEALIKTNQYLPAKYLGFTGLFVHYLVFYRWK